MKMESGSEQEKQEPLPACLESATLPRSDLRNPEPGGKAEPPAVSQAGGPSPLV